MSRLFGSKNRRNFKPDIEIKQTVGESKTEEKYETYDKKKEHKAELWAYLLKEPLLDYTSKNAKKIGVDYAEEGTELYDKVKAYFYISQVFRRLLPDSNMIVQTHNKKVKLSTLVGKTSKSRTQKVLKALRKQSASGEVNFWTRWVLDYFLSWLSGKAAISPAMRHLEALNELQPGDLLYILQEKCSNCTLCNGVQPYLDTSSPKPDFEIDPETLTLK